MLPMWVLALPIWLVVFIVLYALATLRRPGGVQKLSHPRGVAYCRCGVRGCGVLSARCTICAVYYLMGVQSDAHGLTRCGI